MVKMLKNQNKKSIYWWLVFFMFLNPQQLLFWNTWNTRSQKVPGSMGGEMGKM